VKLTGKQYSLLAAGLIAAGLHLSAAFDRLLFPEGPDLLFVLNGLGYLALLGFYFLPIPFFQEKHKLAWLGLAGFAVLTIFAWLVIWVGFSVVREGVPFFSHGSIYGVPAKIAEFVLLALLWADKP
jgi:hypothetical protein